MRNKFLFIPLLSLFLVFNCSSKKDILYLQNHKNYNPIVFDYSTHVLKFDDIIRIKVLSLDPEAAVQFNLGSDVSGNSKELMKLNGYIIDNEGFINFPVLGKIKLSGYTINEARSIIYDLLLKGGHLINHTVDVKLLNSNFTILGEVVKPGTYEFIENNMNILKAIGFAGDLTITAKRENVKLIRDVDGKKEIFNIDLTKSNLMNSDFFQIYSGDIIIVNPNSTRVKNAGIIGNSGTLISLLSFILTSIIIITNN